MVTAIGCGSEEATPDESLARADEYFAAEQYAEAILEYRRALSIDPRLGEARYQLAQAYKLTRDLPDAYQEYMRAADLLSTRADVQVKAGQVLLGARQFEDARTRAQSALALEPKDVDAQILRGNATAGLKQLDRAIEDIEAAIEMAPDSDEAYGQLGLMKLASGRVQEAEEAFKMALEVQPTPIDARLSLAGFYWTSGRLDDAEVPLREALEMEPEHLGAQRTRAAFSGGWGGAAVGVVPHMAGAFLSGAAASRIALADYYMEQQRPEEGLAIYRAVVAEQNDGFATATLRLATRDYQQSRKEDAHRKVDDLLATEPNNAEALIVKARMLSTEGDDAAALSSAQAAVAQAPDNIAALFVMATLLERKDIDAAVAAYTKIVGLNPSASAAQLHLAQLKLASAAPESALDYAEQASRSSGQNPRAQQVLARAPAVRWIEPLPR
jgi:tetratricopeptide (TPR) repeat protein